MGLVEVVGLSHSYGQKRVLEDLNLSVEKGESFALIGPSGAGKTTLLRLMDLLELPSSGEIYFDGMPVPRSGRQRLEIRRRMSLVHQKPQVFNETVYENVACGLRWRGEKETKIEEKVDRILEIVGLQSCKGRNARTLSGGEAQRVALARALVVEPEVLFLDEPTANLDPLSAFKIEQLMRDVASQRRMTIVFATHDMSRGWQLGDRLGVLFEGRLVQAGTPEEVFRSPKNEKVAAFVGAENILEGKVIENREGIVTISLKDGNVVQAISSYAVGKEVCACIRPEEIVLSLARTQTSARNSFLARVNKVTSCGPLSRVDLEINPNLRLIALITRVSAEEMNLREGVEIYAGFKATGVHVIDKEERQ